MLKRRKSKQMEESQTRAASMAHATRGRGGLFKNKTESNTSIEEGLEEYYENKRTKLEKST